MDFSDNEYYSDNDENSELSDDEYNNIEDQITEDRYNDIMYLHKIILEFREKENPLILDKLSLLDFYNFIDENNQSQ